MMDWVQARQITDEQKIVLKTLVESIARPGMKILEVGNWLGESTLVLAGVAKEHIGNLYCVDWWKGSVGTDLEAIASKEDVFSLFWKRMCEEGLEDVVVPIRGSSDAAAEILKGQAFDLVFIDGDHRYDQILKDIKNYAALVKPDGGILCGHDCEGYISDFDEGFLNRGKEIDCYETVHCGVVLAVGSLFQNYAINHSIWSLVSQPGKRTWNATDFSFPDLGQQRQGHPPLLGASESYNIFRYGKRVFAIPKNFKGFDVTREDREIPSEVTTCKNLSQLEERIGERIWVSEDSPMLLSTYRGFNLVKYKAKMYALHESIGPLDLTQTTELEIKELKKAGKCFQKDTAEELKKKIDASIPILVEEDYRKYNIVFYRGKYIAVAQDLGTIRNWDQFDFKANEESGKCFIGDSHVEVLRLIDHWNLRILEEEVAARKAALKKLQNEIREKSSRISALEKAIKKKEEKVKLLEEESKSLSEGL